MLKKGFYDYNVYLCYLCKTNIHMSPFKQATKKESEQEVVANILQNLNVNIQIKLSRILLKTQVGGLLRTYSVKTICKV